MTRDKDGVSFLSGYVANNPDFNVANKPDFNVANKPDFMRQIEQYPWAQTLNYPEAQQRELMQIAREYGGRFDPKEIQNIAEAQILYEKAIAANFDGAVEAFKKFIGFTGNNFTGGGDGDGGGDDDAGYGGGRYGHLYKDMKDSKQRDIISKIMHGVTIDELRSFEKLVVLAAIKEMMIEIAAPTDKSKPYGHPFTGVNIESLAFMMHGKPIYMVPFIAANAPDGVDVKKLTHRVMSDIRQNKIETLVGAYDHALLARDSESLWWIIKGLKSHIEHAAESDRYFAEDITNGIRRPIDLRIVDPTGQKTNTRMFRDLRKQHAEMKRAEEKAAALKAKQDAATRPKAARTPAPVTGAVSQPSYP